MSRDRGTSASPQHDEGGDRSNRSTETGDWRRLAASLGDPYPEQIKPFDELRSKETTSVFSNATRRRIRVAVRQLGEIVSARVAAADRAQSTATRDGLILEIKQIATARAEGLPEDVRAAYLCAAASMVLLAEAADRPEEVPAYVARYRKSNPQRKGQR